jgi:hypothetical protein
VLGIEFQAKHPYNTWWLAIRRDLNSDAEKPVPPGELATARAICAAFEQEGWSVESFAEDTDWPSWDICKDGTGLFNAWTKYETKRNMAEARKILRKFGLTRVPKRRLTLADML